LISLYAVFGGRDELLRAVFDRYGPILVLDEAISGAQTDLYEAVHRIYRALPEAFSREPRVAPAMIACAAPPYHATAATSPVNLTRDRRRLGHHRRLGGFRDLPCAPMRELYLFLVESEWYYRV